MEGTPDRSGPAAGGSFDGDSVAGRVALRREQLGMSREELATRAGMSMAYLGQVEELGTGFDPAGLVRLAAVLGMSYEELVEGSREAPPGRGGPAARPVLQRLSAQECWKRLGTHGIGRLARVTGSPDAAPVLVPVNFLVDGRTVVYRTDPAGAAAGAPGTKVAFETDYLDEGHGVGWSVLVSGTVEEITDPAAVQDLGRRPGAEPWAGGVRELWLRIVPDEVSGRTIRTLPEAGPGTGSFER